jgi:two-component system chemotaxis response regulator CheY
VDNLSGYVLIVEDDSSIREALRETLEDAGYRTAAVEHGQAALEYLAKAALPCLILLDLMMPVMDGATFRSAMLRDERLAAIPVVVITAGGAQLAAQVPANGFLLKPLRVSQVISIVERHCQGAEKGNP